MKHIVQAKGLRFTITLFDEEVRIKENADLFKNIGNAFEKINFLKKQKEKDLLVEDFFKIENIETANYCSITKDVSKLVLILKDGTIKEYEMSSTDLQYSNALNTYVKQIADYIQSKK